MKKTLLVLVAMCALAGALFAAPGAQVRFVNFADPSPYYFTLATDKNDVTKTSVIKDIPLLRQKEMSAVYDLAPGDYYICGSYDQKTWGFNNRSNLFEAGKEYLIIRNKAGEGYSVIVRDLKQ